MTANSGSGPQTYATAAYGAAGQLLTLAYGGMTETRAYVLPERRRAGLRGSAILQRDGWNIPDCRSARSAEMPFPCFLGFAKSARSCIGEKLPEWVTVSWTVRKHGATSGVRSLDPAGAAATIEV